MADRRPELYDKTYNLTVYAVTSEGETIAGPVQGTFRVKRDTGSGMEILVNTEPITFSPQVPFGTATLKMYNEEGLMYETEVLSIGPGYTAKVSDNG